MIRVLVADDSATVRELLVAILESDPGIRVVGHAKNGREAVDMARGLRPDVITMDVQMPEMDGFAATKEIMVEAPTPIIIVSSSSRGRDVDLSLNALRAGALMVVPKPDDPSSPLFNGRQEQFLAMAKAMAGVKVVRRWAVRASPAPPLPGPPPGAVAPRVVAIAASTGGPAALQRVLGDLPGDFPAPILVVQHIARGFTEGLAEWLGASSPLRVKLAEHRERPAPRTVYVAPDDRQLGVGDGERLEVVDAPVVEGFRPSASYLFESAARRFGAAATAVILTGMGRDGVAGLHRVRDAGGHVIAQDRATSVVYGMPHAAVEAGVVDAVLPIEAIAGRLEKLARAGRLALPGGATHGTGEGR
jgi:two-component system chemotaxis response regulator CheB